MNIHRCDTFFVHDSALRVRQDTYRFAQHNLHPPSCPQAGPNAFYQLDARLHLISSTFNKHLAPRPTAMEDSMVSPFAALSAQAQSPPRQGPDPAPSPFAAMCSTPFDAEEPHSSMQLASRGSLSEALRSMSQTMERAKTLREMSTSTHALRMNVVPERSQSGTMHTPRQAAPVNGGRRTSFFSAESLPVPE